MPIEYIGTGGNWYLPSQTAATTLVSSPTWINCTTTASTTCVTAWYYVVSDSGTCGGTASVTWTQPVRISPARLYIAQRSYQQALADDLHDFYASEQRRQQHQISKQHDDAARTRSLELLLAHLSPAQRETFERNKWFIVEGGKSGQRYRIRHAGHMVANIDVLDGFVLDGSMPLDEKATHRLCAHCDLKEVPLFDQLLAQKMMLEYDEERFLKLANKHAAMAA